MNAYRRLGAMFLLLALTCTGLVGQTHRRTTRRTTHRRTTSTTSTPARHTPINSNSFLINDGTPVVGVLNQNLSTKLARNGDSFTMRVTEPSEYRGATVDGHLTGVKRSGKLTGRSEMTLNFDRIHLTNGDTYRFAGTLESLRLNNGDKVDVNNEGGVRDSSQTSKTEKRAAIGGGVGLLIGAIAGGGKGAAIGTLIGAGAGAGSVYAQGRNDLDIAGGTEVTVRASSPQR